MTRKLVFFTSVTINSEAHQLNPVDLISSISTIGDEAKGFISLTLNYKPVAPGSVWIDMVNIRDDKNGVLYDASGGAVGAINYKTGELAIAAHTIIGHETLKITYDYAPPSGDVA